MRKLTMLLAVLALSVLALPAAAATVAFARWDVVPSSYPASPFRENLQVFSFGAEHESYPLRRERLSRYVRPIRFASSVTSIMESDIDGGKISSIDYRLGAWYSFGRIEYGINHGSWHTVAVGEAAAPRQGATQSFTRLELNIKL